jgi:surface polysaccharide O-acyltransferase-like enzyme
MQTETITQSDHFRWVDLIRALGAFLVVLAHVEFSGSGAGVVGDFYYALTRAAVPLFFIASGYLLLSKNESYIDFFRKRAVKAFVPFFIWSVIYLLWHQEGFDKPVLDIVKSYLYKIVRGPRESHLWFFYELFGLYLFTPVLRVYLQKAERKDLFYFFIAWFLLTPVARLIQAFTPVQIGFVYYFLWGTIGYFLFGYMTGVLGINKFHQRIAWGIFIAFLVVTTAGLFLNKYKHWDTQYFGDYISVNVVVMSCALFVALYNVNIPDRAYRIIAPLSRASFGIYLAHVIVMTEIFSTPPFSILPEIGSAIYMIPFLGLF